MKLLNAMMLILLATFVISCSSKPLILDQSIKAKWYDGNETNVTIPFKGILLNDYTYTKMREKINKCKAY